MRDRVDRQASPICFILYHGCIVTVTGSCRGVSGTSEIQSAWSNKSEGVVSSAGIIISTVISPHPSIHTGISRGSGSGSVNLPQTTYTPRRLWTIISIICHFILLLPATTIQEDGCYKPPVIYLLSGIRSLSPISGVHTLYEPGQRAAVASRLWLVRVSCDCKKWTQIYWRETPWQPLYVSVRSNHQQGSSTTTSISTHHHPIRLHLTTHTHSFIPITSTTQCLCPYKNKTLQAVIWSSSHEI